MVGFAVALGVYAAVCSLLWLGFVRLEGLLEDDARTKIANWIRGERSTDDSRRWPASFVELFDRVFGEKHLSWRCFWRSCLASAMAVVVMMAVFMMSYPLLVDEIIRKPHRLIGIGFITAILNLFPDYLSLLETRYILRRMAVGEKVRTLGPAMLSVWLVIDIAATLAIIYAALFCLIVILFGKKTLGFMGMEGAWWLMFDGVTGSWPGIFIYTTFVTSVWLWLYAFSGIVVRLVNRVKRIRDFLDGNLKLQDRPLSVMGGVLVVLFTLVYWPLILWSGVV